jgi:hypothetical protein
MDNALNLMIAQGLGPPAPAWDYQKAQSNALSLQGGEIDLQNKKRDLELRPFKDEMAALTYLTDITPMVQYEDVPQLRDRLIKMGINKSILPDVPYFEQESQKYGMDPKAFFDLWKNNAMTGLQKQALRLKTAGDGWKPGSKQEAMDVAGARGARKVGDKQTYQKGDTEVTERWNGTEWEEIGTGPKWNPKSDEFEITTDKEGNVSVRKGPAATGGTGTMTKPTQTKIEGKLFDATNSLARLQKIEESFKPEFLTYKSKLGQQITSWKAKAGMEISPEEKQSRQEFSTFKRRSISNMNQYLNELSGAAITEQEAKRLTKALPNPGTGIFDGDDPIDFESKMRDVMEEAKLSIARYNYLLANGWTDQQIVGSIKKGQVQSIGAFRSQIQSRIKEIQDEERKAGTYEGDIPGIVKQKVRQEFKI